MALDYRLTLAGETPLAVVAERALPLPDERPVGAPPMLSVTLYERYGFLLTVRSGRDGYVGGVSDHGEWEWEPGAYVALSFHVDKFTYFPWMVTNMLTVVRRVLDSGVEDAALVLNGDVLLFTRFGGVLVKHRRAQWWDHYPAAHQLIVG